MPEDTKPVETINPAFLNDPKREQAVRLLHAVTRRLGIRHANAINDRDDAERLRHRLMFDLISKYGVRVMLLELATFYRNERMARQMIERLVQRSCDQALNKTVSLPAVDPLERSVLAFEKLHAIYRAGALRRLPPARTAATSALRRTADFAMQAGQMIKRVLPLRTPVM